MREILFRGKRIYNGEWVEGYYGAYYKDGVKIFTISQTTLDGEAEYHVIPQTVGQYTGLTDKNGTRIFKNDIISAHLDDLFPEDETRLLVEWHDYGWFGKDSKGDYISLESKWVSELFEVIGNRFDNSELLKGE